MATLTTLTLDGDGTIATLSISHDAGTGSPYNTHCNDTPDGGSSDFMEHNAGLNDGTYDAWFSLSDVDADFSSMTSLNIGFDIGINGSVDNDLVTLSAQIFDGDVSATALTDEQQIADQTDTTRVQPTPIAFGSLTGSEAQWNTAHVRFRFVYDKVQGGGTWNLRLYGCEFDGEYTAESLTPVTVDHIANISWLKSMVSKTDIFNISWTEPVLVPVSVDRQLVISWQGMVTTNRELVASWIQRLSKGNEIPISWRSMVMDKEDTFNVSWKAPTVIPNFTIPVSWQGMITKDGDLNISWTEALSRNRDLNVSWKGGSAPISEDRVFNQSWIAPVGGSSSTTTVRAAKITGRSLVRPSYHSGYTKSASTSEYPGLWDGLKGAYIPTLGPTGTTLRDQSAFDNHATFEAALTPSAWVVDDGAHAIRFDDTEATRISGLDPFSSLGGVGALDNLTISCWCKNTNDWNTNSDYLYSSFAHTSKNLVQGYRNGFTKLLRIQAVINFVAVTLDSTSEITDNGWNLLTYVRRSGAASQSHELWFNGSLEDTDATDLGTDSTNNTKTLWLAGNDNSTANWFGEMGDYLCWDRSLSANEIQRLYNIGRGGIFQRKPKRTAFSTSTSTSTLINREVTASWPQKVGGSSTTTTVKAAKIRGRSLVRPSYHSGFSKRNEADGLAARLWEGCKGLWMPGLGITGTTVRDVSGYGHDLTLAGPSGNPTWDLIPGQGHGLMCDGSTDEQYAEGAFSGVSSYPLTMWQSSRVDGTAHLTSSVAGGLTVGSAIDSYLSIGLRSTADYAIAARNTGYVQGTGGTFAVGEFINEVGVYRSATDRELYANGVSVAVSSTSVTIPTLSTIELGRLFLATNNLGDQTYLACGIWDRELTVAEMRLLSDDPFAMVRNKPRRSAFSTSTSTSTLINRETNSSWLLGLNKDEVVNVSWRAGVTALSKDNVFNLSWRGIISRDEVFNKGWISPVGGSSSTTTVKAAKIRGRSLVRPSYHSGFSKRNEADGLAARLWEGCKGLWMPGLGISGSVVRDVSGHGHDLAFGLTTHEPSWDLIPSQGYGVMCEASTDDQFAQGAFSGVAATEPVSLWCVSRCDGTASIGNGVAGIWFGADSTQRIGLGLAFGGGFLKTRLQIRNTTVDNSDGPNGSFAIGDVVNQVGVFASPTDRRHYRSGVLEKADTTDRTMPTLDTVEFGRGFGFDASNLGETTMLACGIWDRELTVAEMKLLSDDPFAMVRNKPRRSAFSTSTSTSTLINREVTASWPQKVGGSSSTTTVRAAKITGRTLVRPSYHQGFATGASTAEYPGLWKGLVGAWAPVLGNTGIVTLRDVSGYGNHGALTGTMTAADWVRSKGNLGLQYDGTDDHILPSGVKALVPPFTVVSWASTESVAGTENLFGIGSAGSVIHYHRLQFSKVGGVLHCRAFSNAGGGEVGSDTTTADSSDTFMLTGLWLTNADRRSYINAAGENIETTSKVTTGIDTISIGSNIKGTTTTEFFQGNIYETLLYDRALTPNEIRQLYNIGRGGIFKTKPKRTAFSTSTSTSTLINRETNSSWLEGLSDDKVVNKSWLGTLSDDEEVNVSWRAGVTALSKDNVFNLSWRGIISEDRAFNKEWISPVGGSSSTTTVKAAKIRGRSLVRPSYHSGYATSASEADVSVRGLWDGLQLAISPNMGNTGTTTARDTSGHRRHGTLTNMAAANWLVDGGALALDYDGTDQYVDIGDISALYARPTGFSVSSWINADTFDSPNDVNYIVSKDDATSTAAEREWSFFASSPTNDTNASLAFAVWSADADQRAEISTSETLAQGEWFHVAATYEGTSIVLYIDGLAVPITAADAGSFSGTPSTSTNSVRIGWADATAGSDIRWNGRIDDTLIYNRVLNPNEVARIYQEGRGGIFKTKPKRTAFSTSTSTSTLINRETNSSWLQGLSTNKESTISWSQPLSTEPVFNISWRAGAAAITKGSGNFSVLGLSGTPTVPQAFTGKGGDGIIAVSVSQAFSVSWIGTLSDSENANISWKGTLGSSSEANVSWLSKLGKDNQVALSWLGRIGRGRVVNVSWLGSPSIDKDVTTSWLGAILENHEASLDFGKGVSVNRTKNASWMGRVVPSSAMNLSWRGNIGLNRIVNASWLQGIQNSHQAGLEFGQGIGKNNIANVSWMGTLSKDNTFVYEFDGTQVLVFGNQFAISWRGIISEDREANIDWVAPLDSSSQFSMSWPQGLGKSNVANASWMGTLSNNQIANVSWIAQGESPVLGINPQFSISWLAGISKDNDINTGWMGTLSNDNAANIGFKSTFGTNNQASLSWLSKIADSNHIANISWLSGLSSNKVLNAGFMGTSGFNSEIPISYLQNTVKGQDFPITWLQGVLLNREFDISWVGSPNLNHIFDIGFLGTPLFDSNVNLDWLASVIIGNKVVNISWTKGASLTNKALNLSWLHRPLNNEVFNLEWDGFVPITIDPPSPTWILGARGGSWVLSSRATAWILQSRGTIWTLKGR